ncbi:MAG: molybdenum cofactor biosynthesis protein MoaE, partial [Bacteroidota bacterium]
EAMANKVLHDIRETAFEKFDLTCMHIYHSLGLVQTGEICFFVFVSSPHRQAVFDALEWLVNAVKDQVPIFGKELLEDASHRWKVNT